MIRKHSLETAVILAMILLLFFAYGCGGTRQTEIEKHSNIEIQNSYSEGSKIILGNTFTYTPFDALKPMILDGKKYENAIVSNDKSITKETYKHFNVYHHINIVSNKQTTRENNTWLYIGLFAVLVLGVLAWFKLPRVKV